MRRFLLRFIVASALLPAFPAGAAVSFVGAGAEGTVDSGNVTCGIPGSIQNNDVLFAVVYSSPNTAHTCATNCTGWAEAATQTGSATDGRLSVWWKRTSGSESAPTFSGPANSFTCRMWAFRGVKTSGNPWNQIGSIVAEASSATYTGDALTPTVADTMMVFVGGALDNAVWGAAGGSCTNPTASDTACTTQNLCADNNATTDNSVFLAYDATPTHTANQEQAACTNAKTLQSDPGRSLSFALEPLAAPGAPGNPTYSAVTESSMRVEWTAATGADSYKIERAPDSGGSPGTFVEQQTGITNLYYDDSGLDCGTTYWYKVRGTNAGGDGPYDTATSHATSACPTVAANSGMMGFFVETVGGGGGGGIARDSGASYPLLASGTTQATTVSGVTTSAANTLIVVTAGSTNTSGNAAYVSTVAWSGGSGCSTTFTKQVDRTSPGNQGQHASVWTAACSTQASGRSIVVTLVFDSGSQQTTAVAVDALTGTNGIGTSGGQADSSSVPRSVALTGVTAGSWLYVGATSETFPLTPVTNTTELREQNNGTPDAAAAVGINNTGTSGSVTVGWSGSATWSAAAALEILAQ